MLEIKERCTCEEPQPLEVVRTDNYLLEACYQCGKVYHELEK